MMHNVDANQSDIVTALRDIGCSVESLAAVGRGVPDIIVGFRGVNILMEIKTENGKLRESQWSWHSDWRGQAAVVRSVDEAIKLLEEMTT